MKYLYFSLILQSAIRVQKLDREVEPEDAPRAYGYSLTLFHLLMGTSHRNTLKIVKIISAIVIGTPV